MMQSAQWSYAFPSSQLHGTLSVLHYAFIWRVEVGRWLDLSLETQNSFQDYLDFLLWI